MNPSRPGQSEFSRLADALRSIAETVGAYGCILWQEALHPDSGLSDGQLFALEEWFPETRSSALRDLPLNGSLTGKVALSRQPISIENFWQDERTVKDDPFLKEAGIGPMCSIPVQFRKEVCGALNLYRKESKPFSQEEIALVHRLAAFVPMLYQGQRDEVSIDLVTRINQLLHDAEVKASDKVLSKEEMKEVIHDICGLVADSFQAIETSVFLEDPHEALGRYDLVATNWKGTFQKDSYRNGDEGLTGWALTNASSVKIFDLAYFERDRVKIEKRYPGIKWNDSLNVLQEMPEPIKTWYERERPPLGYMAAPVVSGKTVLGVIRCTLADKNPSYFADRELGLLKLIADLISQCWGYWLSRRALKQENLSWEIFFNGVDDLNGFAYRELKQDKPDISRIFKEALDVTNKVIAGAEILDIRLLDKKERVLGFVAFKGSHWHEGGATEIERRKNKTFSVEGKPTSAGALVYQTGQTLVIPNVHDMQFPYDETFDVTARMIVAPIRVRGEIIGVLDIRGTGDGQFPTYARHMASVLGQLLGLYSDLTETILRLKDTESDLRKSADEEEKLKEQQIQSSRDLAHQFKTPTFQAHARIQKVLKQEKVLKLVEENEALQELLAIRGLAGKAKRVAQHTKLFSDLARGKQVVLKEEWLRADDLLKLLIEANLDAKVLVPPEQSIRFHVDKGSFEKPSPNRRKLRELHVDEALLEQMMGAMLDNAGKYSWQYTTVLVHGGWTKKGRFHISVQNTGISISKDEVAKCKEYGWQSDLARDVDSDGAGIGLWVVDYLMKAHGGELEIKPTENNVTEVRLLFPDWRVK